MKISESLSIKTSTTLEALSPTYSTNSEVEKGYTSLDNWQVQQSKARVGKEHTNSKH